MAKLGWRRGGREERAPGWSYPFPAQGGPPASRESLVLPPSLCQPAVTQPRTKELPREGATCYFCACLHGSAWGVAGQEGR